MSDSDDGIPDFSKFLSDDDEYPTALATERENGSEAPTAEIATLPRVQDEGTQLQTGSTSSAPPDAPEPQPQPPPPSQVKEEGQLESSASIGILPTFAEEGESVPVNPDRILVREFTAKLCAKICPSEGSTNKSATVKQSKAKRTSLFASTKSFLSRKALRKTSMDETDVLSFQSVREFLRAIHDKAFDVSALLQVRIFLFEDIVVLAVQPEPNNSPYLKAIGWMKTENLQVRDLEPPTYTFDSFEDQMDSDGEQDGSDAVSDENQAPGREAGKTMFEIRDQSSNTKYVVDTDETNTKKSWMDSLVSLGQMAYRKVKPSMACDKLGWQHTIHRGTLWAAVLEYDIYQIERFLELDSPALHRADGQGLTALHYAAWYGRSLVVKRLLQHGADVTSLDDELRSPLHCAAQQLHVDASSDLIHAKADVNGRDMKERTPLLSCVTHLCTNNLSHSLADTTLSRSHVSDGIELIKLLVSNGADINATDLDGQSSMFLALKNSQVTVMEHLILAGGNIEVTDDLSGQTPLQFVCSNPNLQKRPELLRKLLELGANPNAKSSQNDNTPLDTLFGSENENVKTAMVQELLSHGARIDLAGKVVQAQASEAPYQQACDVWSALTEPPETQRIAQASPGQLPIACDAKSAKWEQDSSVALCRGCTLPFGLMQRKHHCRGCGKVFCSKCSSKTFLMRKFGRIDDVLPAQERVCTMCFNMYCQSMIRAGGDLALSAANKSRLVSSDRKELFENRDQATSQVQGGTGIGAATSALEETQERLAERGEKLERLADKSAAMSASAASFSNAARRLREREEKNSSWFGGLF